jgi:hypothetical protein
MVGYTYLANGVVHKHEFESTKLVKDGGAWTVNLDVCNIRRCKSIVYETEIAYYTVSIEDALKHGIHSHFNGEHKLVIQLKYWTVVKKLLEKKKTATPVQTEIIEEDKESVEIVDNVRYYIVPNPILVKRINKYFVAIDYYIILKCQKQKYGLSVDCGNGVTKRITLHEFTRELTEDVQYKQLPKALQQMVGHSFKKLYMDVASTACKPLPINDLIARF